MDAQPESSRRTGEWEQCGTHAVSGHRSCRQQPQRRNSEVSPSRRMEAFVLPLAAAVVVLAIGAGLWLQRTEHFWRNPMANARFQTVTDFGGLEQAAAISRDGHFVAFLSDRDGPMDVWVTQVGSGEFHNLTHGSAPDLVIHPSEPSGSRRMALWSRFGSANKTKRAAVISVSGPCLLWAANRDHISKAWPSSTGRTTAPGSRTTRPAPEIRFLSRTVGLRTGDRPIFTAPAGLHAHFPLWSPDAAFIYFVQGEPPDKLDIWRIRPDRRNSGADHVAQWACDLSGPVESADADLSRQRSRWLRAMALWHGC